jgi:ornithine carbamoyltransferase
MATEVGFGLLGGRPIFLSPDDVHFGVSESVRDSARVISGFVDLILARVYGHQVLTELSQYSQVPVINGLSDTYHPLQILADLLTLQEHFGSLKGLKLAWVGDGNNIVHSLMMACPKLGMDLRIATPKGYECNKEVIADAIPFSIKSGAQLMFTTDPREAVHQADVIVTDTWISMGQEKEKKERLKAFSEYQVTRQLCKEASKDWVFMHCLPRKAEEVTDDVFYDEKRSLVWSEAENRMWTVMAVMLHLLMEYPSPKSAKPKFGD